LLAAKAVEDILLGSGVLDFLRIILAQLRIYNIDQQLPIAFDALTAAEARYFDMVILKNVDFDTLTDDGRHQG
jgi:hypothetical protein